MNLNDLARSESGYSFAFLDEFAKRELRRRILKAVAIPGYQVPYASREVPVARGWGTGGLQVTLTLVGPESVLKVIDQGADDAVNAQTLRRFIQSMTGCEVTTDSLAATLIQSRHRIPEERLAEKHLLVLQVPYPEPLREVQPSMPAARELHALSDYALLWLSLYEQVVRHGRYTETFGYPVLVHGRYVMNPSPIPRWDVPKFHRAAHLTLLSAGREKRLYAVPPYTDVIPLRFEDVPFRVEDQAGRVCRTTGAVNQFMNEIPLPGGHAVFELSDSGYRDKLREKHPPGQTYYDAEGEFYHVGFPSTRPAASGDHGPTVDSHKPDPEIPQGDGPG